MPSILAGDPGLELGLMGDVKTTLEALLPMLKPKKNDKHLKNACENTGNTRIARSHAEGIRDCTLSRPNM